MRNPRITVAIIGLSVAAVGGGIAVAATAGGSTSMPPAAVTSTPMTSGPTASSTGGPGAPSPSTPATLHTAAVSVGGATEAVLVNGQGLPLYFYKPDTATKSMVSGELASLWPPLDASSPTARGASGTLKVVDTINGHQVTYNGHFLYTFVEDSPGHVSGQGVQNFFVATPGLPTQRVASTSGGVAPTPAAHGYGY
jgi:predicted lipoprotein with Yx(FWY)xxD motif